MPSSSKSRRALPAPFPFDSPPPAATVSAQPSDAGVVRAATLERVRYAHRPSPAARFAASQADARKRMSDAAGAAAPREDTASSGDSVVVPVQLIEERATAADDSDSAAPGADAEIAHDSAPPQDAESRRAARRARREERRAAARAQEEADAARKLESTARRMYFAGFFLLPLLWLVALLYFRREHRSEDANPNIKKYYKYSLIMLILYTAVFLGWFIAFQVKADSVFRAVNILYSNLRSPNNI